MMKKCRGVGMSVNVGECVVGAGVILRVRGPSRVSSTRCSCVQTREWKAYVEMTSMDGRKREHNGGELEMVERWGHKARERQC